MAGVCTVRRNPVATCACASVRLISLQSSSCVQGGLCRSHPTMIRPARTADAALPMDVDALHRAYLITPVGATPTAAADTLGTTRAGPAWTAATSATQLALLLQQDTLAVPVASPWSTTSLAASERAASSASPQPADPVRPVMALVQVRRRGGPCVNRWPAAHATEVLLPLRMSMARRCWATARWRGTKRRRRERVCKRWTRRCCKRRWSAF